MQNENLGEALVRLRTEQGLSRRAAAKQAGISQNYLRMLEFGEHEPSARILRSLAVTLRENPVTLFVLAGFLVPAEVEQWVLK